MSYAQLVRIEIAEMTVSGWYAHLLSQPRIHLTPVPLRMLVSLPHRIKNSMANALEIPHLGVGQYPERVTRPRLMCSNIRPARHTEIASSAAELAAVDLRIAGIDYLAAAEVTLCRMYVYHHSHLQYTL